MIRLHFVISEFRNTHAYTHKRIKQRGEGSWGVRVEKRDQEKERHCDRKVEGRDGGRWAIGEYNFGGGGGEGPVATWRKGHDRKTEREGERKGEQRAIGEGVGELMAIREGCCEGGEGERAKKGDNRGEEEEGRVWGCLCNPEFNGK